MDREQLERYAEELDLWLWTHRREANPQGWDDRVRELEWVSRRLTWMDRE